MEKRQITKSFAILSFFLLSIFACVEPFEIDYNLNENIVIVEATLTDETGPQYIFLKESKLVSNNKVSSNVPLENCKVSVVIDGKDKIQFLEKENEPGSYLSPSNFKIEPNKTYQLVFSTAKGEEFESSLERLEKGAEIKKVYQKLEVIGKTGDKVYQGFHKIYIDTEDPSAAKNYYLWDWNLYEAQEICITCEPQERYYTRPYPGVCIKDLPIGFRNIKYDYECYGACWEILHNNKINIMADDFSNGKTITARHITDVPIYHLNRGAVIEIKQQSINATAYKYYKVLLEQNQNSGGLADTPPVSLIGNIKSKSSSTVAGYFRVADESKYFYWVDRSDVLKTDILPVYLIGRPPNFEPTAEDITRPPLVPCINSYNRTNIKPNGWVDPI